MLKLTFGRSHKKAFGVSSIVFLFSLLFVMPDLSQQSPAWPPYLGFDRNDYPGDAALPILRKSFFFTGYWLGPPPGAKSNSWAGKRDLLRSLGFGFLVLYSGPQTSELQQKWSEEHLFNNLKSRMSSARRRGASDARQAAATARREGFPSHTVIFLDIEEGGRLPAVYHAYLRSWVDQLAHAGFRAGIYCSGMPVDEGGGVTIITADDIRNSIGKRDLAYWVFNDGCPPSPGCAIPQTPPPPTSGVPYATVWQFAQSPRRKQFTARCAAIYFADGNCYASSDTAHAWFLDLDSADTADPSHGR